MKQKWLWIAAIFVAVGMLPYMSWKNLHDPVSKGATGTGRSLPPTLPSRQALLRQLEDGQDFDLLIVGGGATGAGAALDATVRGLKVALVEMDDFAAGTSSRSTKLLHGGVRYLKKAIDRWDYSQFSLVREALHERWNLFQQAPHLTNPIPILTPIYSWSDLLPSLLQLKLYDWIAYPHIHNSYFLTSGQALQHFPQIQPEGLHGAVVYYDGQFDDARFDLALIMTAISRGAVAVNRVKAVDILHEEIDVAVNGGGEAKGVAKDRVVSGAVVEDQLTGRRFEVRAKAVINAAGHFADEIRLMDDPTGKRVLQASAGTHIVLDGRFTPPTEGLLITKTSDRRVVFLLPWHNKTLAGTTDGPCNITNNPRPKQEEIDYILRHINENFNQKVSRSDVLSAWSGIRPLKKAEEAKDTASMSREHAIYTSPSKLMTIIGGKWTTYRKMSEDIVYHAVVDVLLANEKVKTDKNEDRLKRYEEIAQSGKENPVTEELKLVGAVEYNPDYVEGIQKDYPALFQTLLEKELGGKDKTFLHAVAEHLNRAYGDQAWKVAEIASASASSASSSLLLLPNYPFLEAEVLHAIRNEYCVTAVDFLERRIRLALLDNAATLRALPRVVQLMAEELRWDEERRQKELEEAQEHFRITVDNGQ
ncbi:Glycerol-3-phosphate dehydrogenase [Balamuthia mandrillaris]